MDVVDRIGALTEGKFIDEYLAFYPEDDIAKDGQNTLKKVAGWVEKTFKVKGEGVAREGTDYTFSFEKGEHVDPTIHMIYWDESSKAMNQSGKLYTLYYQNDASHNGVPFKNSRELMKIMTAEGVPRK